MFRLGFRGYDPALVEGLLEIMEDEPQQGLKLITTAQFKQLLAGNPDISDDMKYVLKKEIKLREKMEKRISEAEAEMSEEALRRPDHCTFAYAAA